MYRITKQIVNGANNVIAEDLIAHVDCNSQELKTYIIPKFHKLAQAKSLYYKDRGQSNHVRYVFEYFVIGNIEAVIKLANEGIKNSIEAANSHIDFLNSAVKESNKRNRRDIKYGVREHHDINDYAFNEKYEAKVEDYKLIVD